MTARSTSPSNATDLTPRTGHTVRGLPVSINRAPDADLAQHIARFFITVIEQPDTQTVTDFLLNETGFVRALVRGRWEARLDGRWESFDGPLLFGAQGRPMPVRVRGPIAVAGFAVRPSAWAALVGHPADAVADTIQNFDGAFGQAVAAAVAGIDDHEATFAAMAQAVRTRLAIASVPVDAAMARFEHIAHVDPTRSVADVADSLGLITRNMSRRARRVFGHSPKLVLRRSRFLDMAAVLRGLSVPSADELAALRFYDQSHLNREFRLFAGMTPVQFERTATPLLTLGIEARQRRKLEQWTMPAPVTPPWLA